MSSMSKIKANAVSYSLFILMVYAALLPPVEDLDEVLAFIYLGPNVPTKKEFKCTPMLIRRKKVAAALKWLKLNHVDYADLDIFYNNMSKYPKD